jgi:hypothetical protein
MRGAIPPLPYTSSWRGAQLSTGTILPLLHWRLVLFSCGYRRITLTDSYDKGKVFPVLNQVPCHADVSCA